MPVRLWLDQSVAFTVWKNAYRKLAMTRTGSDGYTRSTICYITDRGRGDGKALRCRR
jgi:hypothetical protein